MKITYLLLTFLAINVISANGQTADFSFTTPNNQFCSPQVVTFTASTSGNPTSYIWNFGDGLSGGAPVENHLYDFPGTYNVSFTAVYANSASTVTKTVIIYPTPTVTLAADRNLLCQPGTVNFTATISGPAAVNSYEWNFGDGSATQTTTTPSINHNFSAYGSFNVTVKSSTANGCNSSANTNISVSRFPISVTVSPSNGCLPAVATLTATTSFPPGDGLQNIIWNFGDGTPNVNGSSPSVVHTYSTTNPITNANVSITSNLGCTNQFTLPRFAYGIPPTNTNAYTTALRDTFCGSETIEFFGFADSANLYHWNFGDGSTDTTSNTLISHKYSSLGNMQVTLTPYYNNCAGQTRIINIFITGVIASYTYSNLCNNKTFYSFANSSQGTISSYAWTFSDAPGFVETSIFSPTHTFPSSATSLVKLVVIDNITGCSDSLSSFIYTAVPNLIADKNLVCKDSTITYQVLNTYPTGSGHEYEFNVNSYVIPVGGTSLYSIIPRNFGMFNDFVVISDGIPGTCNDTLFVPQPIKVSGPVVDFTYPSLLCADTSVLFQNITYPFFASDNIVKWLWSFGDGQKDSVMSPAAHLYATPGQHIVQLEATDINGCKQQKTHAIVVGGLPILTVFPSIDTVCLGQSVMLEAYTIDSLIWQNHPEITCQSCDTLYITPVASADYIATAISNNGCRTNDTARIRVFAPINLSVTPVQTAVCAGTPVQLNLNSGGYITWSPSTFLNNASIQDPVSTPYNDITYTVSVRDSVGCFTDSATATITVFPDPVVNAGPDQFLPYNSSFTLSPIYAPGTQTYLWTPAGNLSCTNCPSPSGVALQKQEFTIAVTDVNNCTGEDKVTIFVGCELSNLLLPSAFTPNSDGRNERFYPIARGYKEIKSFTVFNRNGAKVFERKNFQPNIPSEGWDGRVKNAKGENTQSYVWIIEGICDTGMPIVAKGTVLLIR